MPTYFQTMMLVACDVFVRAEVDVVILEVGIGGRLDATTAAISAASAHLEDGTEQPLFDCVACGVTLLDLDHTEILGDTLSAIGREKAGIFRAGVPAFTIQQSTEGHKALQGVAFEVATKLEVVPPLRVGGPDAWQLGIAGDCQPVNAALALRLAQRFLLKHPLRRAPRLVKQLSGFRLLGDKAKRAVYAKGLKYVRFLGRATHMQMPRGTQAPVGVFMDGAHTPLSAECVSRWFQNQLPSDCRNAALIFNVVHTRDPVPLLCALAGAKHNQKTNPFQTVIFCPSKVRICRRR